MNYEVIREAMVLCNKYTKKDIYKMYSEEFQEETLEDKIVGLVSNYYNVSTEQVLGRSRKREIIDARHISAYFLYKHSNLKSIKAVATYMRKSCHSTVINSRNIVEGMMYDEKWKNTCEFIEEEILKFKNIKSSKELSNT